MAHGGAAKLFVFRLRTAKGETSLSLYDSTDVTALAVIEEAPGPGWGVAGITAGELRRLGFVVRKDGSPRARGLARAHVSATPPVTDKDGQITPETLQALSFAAFWVIAPAL